MCQSVEETVHHYIMKCSAHVAQRKQVEEWLGRVARSLSILLANPNVFKHLFRFINNTGQFQNLSQEE